MDLESNFKVRDVVFDISNLELNTRAASMRINVYVRICFMVNMRKKRLVR